MFNRKFLCRLMAASLIIGGSNFLPMPHLPIVHAAVETYVGTGEYIMGDFETPDTAKQRARARAERNAREQAGVYVQSYSRMVNFKLLEDEIVTMSSGVIRVLDVQYSMEPIADGKTILCKATLKADIDTSEIDDWIKRDPQERAELIAQNRELKRLNDEQERQINSLKEQLAGASNQNDRDRIVNEIGTADQAFLSNRKLEEGDRLFADKNYSGAIAAYDEALTLNPNSAAAYDRRGNARVGMKDFDRAMADFDAALKIDPNFALAYNDRGAAYLKHDEPSKAIEDLSKAIKLAPSLSTAYSTRASSYLVLGEVDNMIADYSRAIGLEPNNAGNYIGRSGGHIMKGDLEQALDDCNSAVNLDPEVEHYHVMRGWVYSFMGDPSRALLDFDKAIELDPDKAMTYVERGVQLTHMGYFPRAATDFDKAIKLDRKNAEAYLARADLYASVDKKYSKAIDYYEKAIELEPENSEAYNNRGVSYHRLKDYRKALADFDKALALKEDYFEAYVNRGVVYKALGDNDKALKNFNKALELEEEKAKRLSRQGKSYRPNAAIYHNLARYYEAAGDEAKRKKYMDLASLAGIDYYATDFVTGDGILIPLYKLNF